MSEELNQEEFEVETITLPLEDGTELECAILDEFDMDGKLYMALAPIENDSLGEETYLYRFEEFGEEIQLYYIEDENELNAASAAYEQYLDSIEKE